MSNTVCNINIGSNSLVRGVESLIISSDISTHVTTAKIELTLENSTVASALKKDAPITIDYGTADNSATISMVIEEVSYTVDNKFKIFALSDGRNLTLTKIKESYNDESSSAIVKRLVTSASLTIGSIKLDDIIIPHILFNDLTIKQAIDKVLSTVRESTGIDVIYFIDSDGKFMMMPKEIELATPKIMFVTGMNVLTHISNPEVIGSSVIETFINPKLEQTDTIKIDDTRKKINKLASVIAVEHSIIKGIARSKVWY